MPKWLDLRPAIDDALRMRERILKVPELVAEVRIGAFAEWVAHGADPSLSEGVGSECARWGGDVRAADRGEHVIECSGVWPAPSRITNRIALS